MNAPFPVSWIFILFLLLILFGAFAAIIWRSWVVGSIVLVFIFLIFGLYFVRVGAPLGPPAMTAIQESTSATVDRTQPDIDFLKTANIYSSMDEAAKFLAMRLCDQIQQSKPPLAVSKIHIVTAKQ